MSTRRRGAAGYRLISSLLLFAAVAASPNPAAAQQVPELYSLSRDNATLFTIDPENGASTGSQAITLAGRSLRGGRGLAASPVTQQLFAVLAFREDGNTPRLLATIDPVSGIATEITATRLGQTAALAFDTQGTLYGGQAANAGEGFANKLYVFDTVTGERTEFMPIANSEAGLALALNPLDGYIYHLSGSLVFGTDLTTPVFEKIDTATMTRIEIPVSGDDMGHVRAMAFGEDGNFLVVGTFDPFGSPTTEGRFFRLTPDGEATILGSMNHFSKGMAYVPPITAPEPEMDTDFLSFLVQYLLD